MEEVCEGDALIFENTKKRKCTIVTFDSDFVSLVDGCFTIYGQWLSQALLQFIHPIGDSKMNVLVRAGGLFNHIEVEQGDDIISDTDHGFGWQVEGGLAIALGESWRLMPSIRYRSLARDLTLQSVTTSVELNYISAGLGIALLF